jgi:hypothetical protein
MGTDESQLMPRQALRPRWRDRRAEAEAAGAANTDVASDVVVHASACLHQGAWRTEPTPQARPCTLALPRRRNEHNCVGLFRFLIVLVLRSGGGKAMGDQATDLFTYVIVAAIISGAAMWFSLRARKI